MNIAEIHLLGYDHGDFYDSVMRVALIAYIRPEVKFPSLDALIKQITNDISIANSLNQNSGKDTKLVKERLSLFLLSENILNDLNQNTTEGEIVFGKSNPENNIIWAEIEHFS